MLQMIEAQSFPKTLMCPDMFEMGIKLLKDTCYYFAPEIPIFWLANHGWSAWFAAACSQ
jgi:hypothetical protein